MSVDWRIRGGTDAIVHVGAGGEAFAMVEDVDAAALKSYLAVTGDLDGWRKDMSWQQVTGDERSADGWGALVFSRSDDGEVIFVDPERFWDGVYRWFRSRGVDYNT